MVVPYGNTYPSVHDRIIHLPARSQVGLRSEGDGGKDICEGAELQPQAGGSIFRGESKGRGEGVPHRNHDVNGHSEFKEARRGVAFCGGPSGVDDYGGLHDARDALDVARIVDALHDVLHPGGNYREEYQHCLSIPIHVVSGNGCIRRRSGRHTPRPGRKRE